MASYTDIHKQSLVDGGSATYAKWADTFDDDIKQLGSVGPKSLVSVWRLYHSGGSKKWKIFDAGCGTGRIGEELKKIVSTDEYELYGGDLSPDMLEKAKDKKLYNDLKVVNLKETLPYEPESFDSVVSNGVFVPGHCGSECLPNIMNVLKKNCYFIMTTRIPSYEETKSEWEQQIHQCGCTLVEKREEPYFEGISDGKHNCFVLVIQKN